MNLDIQSSQLSELLMRTGDLYALATKQDLEDLRTYVLLRDQEILQNLKSKKKSGRHSYMSRKDQSREES
jgi:hypothetical protein